MCLVVTEVEKSAADALGVPQVPGVRYKYKYRTPECGVSRIVSNGVGDDAIRGRLTTWLLVLNFHLKNEFPCKCSTLYSFVSSPS